MYTKKQASFIIKNQSFKQNKNLVLRTLLCSYVYKHVGWSRKHTLEKIDSFVSNSSFPGPHVYWNTSNFPGEPKMVQEHINFPGEAKRTSRTDQIFQESFKTF